MLDERDIGPVGMKLQSMQHPVLQQLLDAGIDDLAKYRIVQYLRECARPLDATSIAACLGLHPPDLVSATLESLAFTGVLVRGQTDPPCYMLSCHPPLDNAIQRLFSPVPAKDRELIFRALASASLAKARARCRGNGREVRG